MHNISVLFKYHDVNKLGLYCMELKWFYFFINNVNLIVYHLTHFVLSI
jgi:hypothetical protein